MGLKRIIWHWTAGTYQVSATDLALYHFVISGDGVVVTGRHAPEANLGKLRSGHYAAHTLNLNSGSIGLSMAGMKGSKDYPFAIGSHPLKEVQIDTLVEVTAKLCKEYDIPVSRETTLSHAEVQQTLNTAQRGKRDIDWLPGMTRVANARDVGDDLRARVLRLLEADAAPRAPAAPVAQPMPRTIRRGDRGEDVRRLQKALLLRADGIFGPITQSELRSHQSEHGLTPDGICGPKTWATIIKEGY